ncbi:LysR family transcriptional regulator [Tetragenococcus halophilus]|nr:LysR family transcriptional regulator [Tetragenococcus halophilus]
MNFFFGPGVLDVLNLVNENGSLSQAAKEMGMSYNKAWRIVQKAEKLWGKKLIVSKIGGFKEEVPS